MDYKQILKDLPKWGSVHDIIEHYARPTTLFTIKDASSAYYELVFNKQINSTVIVPIISDEQLSLSPYYFLDDDNIILNAEEILKMVLISRFEYFREQTTQFKYHRFLKIDLTALQKNFINVEPFAHNNRVKISNRIRIVKTYKDTKDGIIYHNPFGVSLWDPHIPNSEEDVRKYSKLFHDPISVVAPSKGVYCMLGDQTYMGAGFKSDKEAITSVYPAKSNLPERLRTHYTSNFLEPLVKEKNPLMASEIKEERINGITVFVPVTSDIEDPFGDGEGPLGKWALSTGEILTNRRIAEKEVYVRRTMMTTESNVDVVSPGEIVQPGDVLAYNCDGLPDLIYDLNYENAEVESVEKVYGCFKIILKIVAPLGVARLISDTGLKGVTHPREQLGSIVLDNGTELPVDLCIGPNSMKTANGIRLAWLALKNYTQGTQIDLDPDKYTSEEINEMTKDLKKVKWIYNDRVYEVYAGLVSFGVTDLAKDCRTGEVRILPETLKYMYLSGNEGLAKAADSMLGDRVSNKDKWIIKELLKLKARKPIADDNVPVKAWDDEQLQGYLRNSYLQLADWHSANTQLNNILTSPFNEGFYIYLPNETYIRMPSSHLLRQTMGIANGNITFPSFLTPALWILLSLKSMFKGNTTLEKVMDNVNKYHEHLNDFIFSKKSALSTVFSPSETGGHLKQMVSSDVPRGITVVIDPNLEKLINNFRKEFKGPVYNIGVRNPVVWQFQFSPTKVWTLKRFEQHLEKKGKRLEDVILKEMVTGAVLRNTLDTLYDQADTDGDLFPIVTPLNHRTQGYIADYMRAGGQTLTPYEIEWTNEYIKGECDNSKFINIEPFEYHKVKRDWLAEAFANAAIAKMRVGVGTVDLWKFHACAEMWMADGRISKEQLRYVQFLFSRIVHDTIIRSIKHVEDGASGYDLFALKSIDSNKERVYDVLIRNMQVPADIAQLFVEIALDAQGNPEAKALSRIPSGGVAESIWKLVSLLPSIPKQYENVSYFRIMKEHIPYLKAINTEPVLFEDMNDAMDFEVEYELEAE